MDSSLPLSKWKQDLIGLQAPPKALQGAFDTALLFAPPALIKKEVHAALSRFSEQEGALSLIANLGHGILPGTPIQGVQAFVDSIRDFRLTT